jgi:hypothetical protein
MHGVTFPARKGMTLHTVTRFLLEVESNENGFKNVNIWFNMAILIILQPNCHEVNIRVFWNVTLYIPIYQTT